MTTNHPVLIVGGSGVVGSRAARMLRRLHPDLPIAIGGRDLRKAEAVAAELGGAHAVAVDLARPDLGLSAPHSAVAMFVKDHGLQSLRYAQALGVPYLDIQTGLFELGPLVALAISAPARSAILLDSGWLAGAAAFPALHFAKEFRSIERIELGVILDEQDMGGPEAYADYERYMSVAPNPLIFEGGQWRWVKAEQAGRTFHDTDGVAVQGQAYAALDVLSLGIATGARSVRCDFAMGVSPSRRRGERFSAETIIEITGEREPGRTERVRHEIIYPEGQAPVTALNVALGIERLLGRAGGAPVAPGLYTPETLIDAEYFLGRQREIGAQFRRGTP